MDCDSFAFVDALIWDDVPDLDEKRGMLKCVVDSKGNFCSRVLRELSNEEEYGIGLMRWNKIEDEM